MIFNSWFILHIAYPYKLFTGIGVEGNLGANGYLNQLGTELGSYSTSGGKLFNSVKCMITIILNKNELITESFFYGSDTYAVEEDS